MTSRKRPAGGGKFLLEYDEVPSTQDIAKTLYKCGDTAIIGIIARYQSAGRGRLGREWVAPAGTCLLVTYIVPIRGLEEAPRIGLAVALAVAETIEEKSELAAGLKWPNDVLLNGRKTAGILVETATRNKTEHAALVGIGVNLNVESFPGSLEQTATSVRIEVRRETDVDVFESELRDRLFETCSELAAGHFEELRGRWMEKDQSRGRCYRVEYARGAVEGVAESIAESGALVIRLADGRILETLSATAVS